MTDREILQLILSKVDKLEAQVSENTQVLKALEHNSEVHKAELDNINHNIAELSGDVRKIKSAVVKGEKAYEYLQSFSKITTTDI